MLYLSINIFHIEMHGSYEAAETLHLLPARS